PILSPQSNQFISRSHFFFFIIQPPPTSTIFPYTTLFRSDSLSVIVRTDPALRPGDQIFLMLDGQPLNGGVATGSQFTLTPLDRGDRKSTRLNSSHVAISYAVFCLKKKKIPHRHGISSLCV